VPFHFSLVFISSVEKRVLLVLELAFQLLGHVWGKSSSKVYGVLSREYHCTSYGWLLVASSFIKQFLVRVSEVNTLVVQFPRVKGPGDNYIVILLL